MKIFAETDRIILREIVLDDALPMYHMEADPEVHTYLDSTPINAIEEAINIIDFIRKQYVDYGIGRWAIELKETGQFVGWGGLKYRPDEVNGHIGFYELGYRLLRKFWGLGLATESAEATLKYAFEELHLDTVYAMADSQNKASENALLKSGFKFTAEFKYKGVQSQWFEIAQVAWKNKLHF